MEIIKNTRLATADNIKNSNVTPKTVQTALDLLDYLPVWEDSLIEFELDINTNNRESTLNFIYSINNTKLHIVVSEATIKFNNKTYNKSTNYIGIYEIVNSIKLAKANGIRISKLCLFTGAFNPPTIAHYHMVKKALNNKHFDFVIIGASNQTFLNKKQSRINGWAYPEEKRVRLLLAMTRQNPQVLILGIEQGYTYDVLCEVKDKYNPDELYFALGSDKLHQIERWGNTKKLTNEFCFYVMQRSNDLDYIESKSKKLFKNTKYIIENQNDKYKKISATQVRDLIDKHLDFGHLVTDSVYNELMNKH